MKGGSYTVAVSAGPGNGGNGDKFWKVTSTGTFEGAARTVECWLHLESFARYAYFTDAEVSSGAEPIYFVSADRITGPTHTNGYYSFSGTPRFSSVVSSANSGDPLYNGGLYVQGGRNYSDRSLFYHYRSGYAQDRPSPLDDSPTFSFSGAQPPIPLPTTSASISALADLRVQGDATLTFSSAGTVLIHQNGHHDTAWPTASTTIYVVGTATVQGTVAGRVTVGASNGIDVVDNLVYRDKTQDVLGLISDTQIRVATAPYSQKDIEIDAAIMALQGSFTVANYDSGVYRGTLHVFGGITQKYRGPVGTFSGSGQVSTGYVKDYVYDDRLVNLPPPNFPTTGKVSVRSFVDLGAIGH
jgi:hypothetical protein